MGRGVGGGVWVDEVMGGGLMGHGSRQSLDQEKVLSQVRFRSAVHPIQEGEALKCQRPLSYWV